MKIEPRYTRDGQNRALRGVVLICETTDESALIDEVAGSKVRPDGLIGRVQGEVCLSDGYGEHYIYIPRNP